jgi:hypothetical protein
MPNCRRCGAEVSAVHTNADVGFVNVCDKCQYDAHVAFNATEATRRAAAIAAKGG